MQSCAGQLLVRQEADKINAADIQLSGTVSPAQVTVCESHSIPGGAAHAWVDRAGYHFESGPSLYSGMSGR